MIEKEKKIMERINPGLRTLFFVLSILALLSTAVGGYLYYSALKSSLFEAEHTKGEEQLHDIINEIDVYKIWSLKSAKFLSDLKQIKQSVINADKEALLEVNEILDHFHDDIKIEVCYLMDESGKTIASSNRNTPASFVGKNYGFRPYFKQAMQGEPSVYMALGVTSKIRGIYFSHPVYGENKDKPVGVVVIKTSIDAIEEKFTRDIDGIALMTDPHGVIFVSSHNDWLYQILWEPSSQTVLDLIKSKQFGTGPWNWTGMKMLDKENAVDKSGNTYRIHQQAFGEFPGWNLTYLHSQKKVAKKITGPLTRTVGLSAAILFVCFGIIVFFLFKKADTEIVQRKKAEQEQKLSLSRLEATLESTADGIMVVDKNGKIIASNELFARLWKIPDSIMEIRDVEKVRVYIMDQLKNPDDFIEKTKKIYADPEAKSLEILHFKDGRIMERYSHPQKLDDQIIGRVWSFRDITQRILAEKKRESLIVDLKKALNEVKSLQGIIPICSSCKQIRDDKGYWNKIETYIRDHSGAEFSHSMCPECSDKLYGDEDWYIEMKKEESKE